jgi:hypothetical protein
VQRFGCLHLTNDLYVPSKRPPQAHLPTVTNLGSLAVSTLKNLNLEPGRTTRRDTGLDSYPIYGNGRSAFPSPPSFGTSRLAGGIFDAAVNGRHYQRLVYGRRRRPLGRSDGYQPDTSGNRKLLVDGNGKKDNAGVMVAWERTMPEITDRLWLCVDYMGTKSAYGTLNFGGSWKFTDAMVVVLGYEIYNDSRISPNTITIQADVDIDLGAGE